MKKHVATISAIFFLFLLLSVSATDDIIGRAVTDSSDSVIMTEDQIEKWNGQNDSIHISSSVLSYGQLKEKIFAISMIPSGPRYVANVNGTRSEVRPEYYTALRKSLNINSISEKNEISYGIVISRSPLRTFPTDDVLFSSVTSPYDRFQESVVLPFEPVAVLHTSTDGKWLFIKMYNYEGWIKKENVALTSKDIIDLYESNMNFIVIQEPKAYMLYSDRELDMGIEFPLVSINEETYTVLCPQKDNNGCLTFSFGYIKKDDASIGYLPYTQKNVLTQASKFIGEPYSWGGMNGYRDCSSLMMDIYRSMGIKLRRNTDQQETMSPENISVGSLSINEKQVQLDGLPAGTMIFMDGHVMLYIGKYDQKYYILHDTPGYYMDKKYFASNGVTVTTVDIRNSADKAYMELFTAFLYIH
ncbi:MAG: SH3 domain-containing protein [Clostridia bacterium]|jgi:hypothetical protein